MKHDPIRRLQTTWCRITALTVALSLFATGAVAEEMAVLELERSADLQDWENIPVTGDMLGFDGKIRLPVGGSAGFYRLRVEILPPGPAPEGMVLIPSGIFEMGDSFDEWNANERPVHSVYLSAFYMGVTPVTKAQWDEVHLWAVSNGYVDLPVGDGKGPDHPVHSVNWFDAVKWLNAWSEKEELTPVYRAGDEAFRTGGGEPTIDYSADGYRLPTEAEWEKAARGGLNGRRFPWGDTISHHQANYYANGSEYSYDTSPYTDWTIHPTYRDGTFPFTSPVASFAPNGYGLYDMAGNVWEMCNDWWGRTYDNHFLVTDPRGPSSSTARMKRGGNWMAPAVITRVAFRSNMYPDTSDTVTGFRPVRGSFP